MARSRLRAIATLLSLASGEFGWKMIRVAAQDRPVKIEPRPRRVAP